MRLNMRFVPSKGTKKHDDFRGYCCDVLVNAWSSIKNAT